MPKQQRRKPPKRKQPIEDGKDLHELIELAMVIDEHRLAQNATGWFVLPWRDGRNAFELAFDIACEVADEATGPHVSVAEIIAVADTFKSADDLYYRAEQLIAEAVLWKNQKVARVVRAAARCAQLWISNSSGGGHGYNDVLRRDVADLATEEIVTEWRCHDAIGTGPMLQGDAFDRQRGAFLIAWKRGLYHAAYSIAPVK